MEKVDIYVYIKGPDLYTKHSKYYMQGILPNFLLSTFFTKVPFEYVFAYLAFHRSKSSILKAY